MSRVDGLPRENTFDHLRADDREHVGYLHVTDDGRFIPFDLLHRRRGEPMELDEAEALLDRIGLSMLTVRWWLDDPQEGRVRVAIRELHRATVTVARTLDDLSGPVAKAVDLTATTTLPLPTDRLHEHE